LFADMVDGVAAEKHPAIASSPSPAHRDREHTSIQSRAVTVASKCSAVSRTAHSGEVAAMILTPIVPDRMFS
jgi:hypothetical protein